MLELGKGGRNQKRPGNGSHEGGRRWKLGRREKEKRRSEKMKEISESRDRAKPKADEMPIAECISFFGLISNCPSGYLLFSTSPLLRLVQTCGNSV